MSRAGAAAPEERAAASGWRADLGDHVISLRVAPGGDRVAAASVAGPVDILDLGDGRRQQRLAGHAVGTLSLDWSPDGSLATGGQDGHARLWDAAAGEQTAAIPGGAGWVARVAWSPDGQRLALAAGRRVRLADRDGTLVRDWDDHESTVTDLAWRPDGAELATTSYGGVTIFSPRSREPRRRLPYTGSSLALAWSPDGRHIATGDQDATVHFWIVRRARDLMMSGYRTKVLALDWDAAGRLLATSGGPEATVWRCSGTGPAGTRPLPLRLGDEADDDASAPFVSALAFAPHGDLLAVGDASGRVGLFRPRAGQGLLGASILDEEATCLAWSPDGAALVAGTAAGTVALARVERLLEEARV